MSDFMNAQVIPNQTELNVQKLRSLERNYLVCERHLHYEYFGRDSAVRRTKKKIKCCSQKVYSYKDDLGKIKLDYTQNKSKPIRFSCRC